VHFKPIAGETGLHNTNLVLHTSAGIKQISLSVFVTNDPGQITLSATPNIQSYTCESVPFDFIVKNTTCNPIEILRITNSGSDFVLPFSDIRLAQGAQQTIIGTFSPQDSNGRTTTVILTIKYSDGST